MTTKPFARAALVLLLGLMPATVGLADGGIGGTGITALGPIERFGSIFVDHREYALTGASVAVDGRRGNQATLKLGQVVLVRAHRYHGRVVVQSVAIRHAVQGIVTAVGAYRFTVLGQTIHTQATLTRGSWANLRAGDLVRVSALPTGPQTWLATRVNRLAHRPARYTVLLRGPLTASSATGLVIGSSPFAWRGGPISVARGTNVLVTGTAHGDTVEFSTWRPDRPALGGRGTDVHLVGMAYRTGARMTLDGATLASPNAFTGRGLADVDGRVNRDGQVAIEQLAPFVLSDHGQRTRPERPAGLRSERPEIPSPEIERPEIERPSMD